ncbi:MAG TPA: hypothetical protein VIM34_11460 [Burkholderiaceae bacterium]
MNEATLSGMRAAARGESPAFTTGATSAASAVSWPAIVAGAIGAAALSLILLILGMGLGLSAVSPWAGQGASAGTFGMSTILWVSFTQLTAAGMGGYLAGRLRTRWGGTHADEVYFRDTAHGFLSWALATLVTAAVLTSVIGAIVSGGARATAAATAGAVGTAAAPMPTLADAAKQVGLTTGQDYFVDSLFRKDTSGSASTGSTVGGPPEGVTQSAAEVGRIFAAAMTRGTLATDDLKYLGQMVSQRTGLPQADAEKRAADTFARMQTKAKEAEAAARDVADKARKTSSYSALWLFVSLLLGAFCASLAATFGGRRRDLF